MRIPDDGSATWAQRHAEQKVREAEEALRQAAYRLHPVRMAGDKDIPPPKEMDVRRAGSLIAFASTLEGIALWVRRLRRGDA